MRLCENSTALRAFADLEQVSKGDYQFLSSLYLFTCLWVYLQSTWSQNCTVSFDRHLSSTPSLQEAEEKASQAANRKQQLALLTEELERLKATNAELSQEVPLLTAQNQQLRDEQEAQARRTADLQMTIDYMQEWQAVLKQKVAHSTGDALTDQGSAERGDASVEQKVRGTTAKKLDFEFASQGVTSSPEYATKGRTPDTAMREREECARIFVQGLERAMVGSPISVPVRGEEGDLQQLVSEVERDMGGERIRELEALVVKLTAEVTELRKGAEQNTYPEQEGEGEVSEVMELQKGAEDEGSPEQGGEGDTVSGASGREAELVQKLEEEQARREAAERRNEELARQLADQVQFYSSGRDDGMTERGQGEAAGHGDGAETGDEKAEEAQPGA